ncbi:MAG: SufD family Fe-S cluster assembly protein [Halobacteriales archaeon]|nr:SufD family Fe-S cluster assembly protein [Halobacteriales archaeon]
MMSQAPTNFTPDMVRQRSEARKEPAWLLEDRLAALQRYASLAVESNPLFTRHVELPKGVERLQPGDIQPTLTVPGGQRGAADSDLGGVREAATNQLDGFAHDKYSNLVRALFGGGAVLHIPRGAHVEQPFVIRYDTLPPSGAAFARNVIVLEPGARATVLLETAGDAQGVLGLTTECFVGDGAELRLLGVDTAGERQSTLLTTAARVGEQGVFETHHAFTGGALVKARTDIALAGRGSRTQLSEVVFGQRQQRFDLTTNIAHAAPESTSDATSKAVLRDSARANLKGVISLQQSGKDSDSYLQQHAMLLSRQARCIAIPSLEIVNREIKRAKHAATVAQIDEMQLFYLETRGLSEAEARKAIVLGFLGPLLQRLGDGLAERVQESIGATWA